MKTKKYTRVETDNKKRRTTYVTKDEKVSQASLPPESETDNIIDEMLLEGCYVSDLFERFGVEFHEP